MVKEALADHFSRASCSPAMCSQHRLHPAPAPAACSCRLQPAWEQRALFSHVVEWDLVANLEVRIGPGLLVGQCHPVTC